MVLTRDFRNTIVERTLLDAKFREGLSEEGVKCITRMQRFVDELIDDGIDPKTIITTLPQMAVYTARKDKDGTLTYLRRLVKTMKKAAEDEPVTPRPAGLSSYDP